MGDIMTGPETVAKVREMTGPKTILAFSTGKDCIAAMLAIRDSFDEVIPYYLHLVPGLEFIEESLAYYERTLFNGAKIWRIPHPSLYRMLTDRVFVTPDQSEVLNEKGLVRFDYQDVQSIVRKYSDAPDAYTATGVRAADSPMRRISIKTHGPISGNKKEYLPVWDWKKADLMAAFRANNIRLSPEYKYFGRSYDGLDARFMVPMKRHFPRDYNRVLEWFPLVEAEIFRYEKMWGYPL